ALGTPAPGAYGFLAEHIERPHSGCARGKLVGSRCLSSRGVPWSARRLDAGAVVGPGQRALIPTLYPDLAFPCISWDASARIAGVRANAPLSSARLGQIYIHTYPIVPSEARDEECSVF